MSANVESMMYRKQSQADVPWHKLGTPVANLATAEECIIKARLDWEVAKRPIYVDGTNEGEVDQVPDYWATVRTDRNQVLGVVGNQFTPLQNREAFGFFDAIVGEGAAIYETAGSLAEGRKIWLLAKLPGEIKVVGDDITDKYLLLANGHDGMFNLTIGFTPIRVVCQNTLNAALNGQGQFIRMRHTINVAQAVQAAGKIMRQGVDFFKGAEEQFQVFAKTPITDKQADQFFRAVYDRPVMESAEKQGRRWSGLNELGALFQGGMGTKLPGVRGTLWGAYNAVTEYEDHRRKVRDTTDRLDRNWFGDGARTKLRAFNFGTEIVERGLSALAGATNN